MGRPTSTGVSQIALNTNQGKPGGLGVHQSLNVTARKPGSAQLAAGLADILGVTGDVLKPVLEAKEARHTREGIRDATLGKVDDKRQTRSQSYAEGVREIEVRTSIFGARAEWAQHYAENVDKRLPAEAVAQLYDTFMKERLGPLMEADSKAAARMAPEYIKGMQELVVSHQAQLTKQHIEEAQAVMQQEVVDAMRRGEPVQFLAAIDPLHKLTGDLSGSITTGIHAVGAEAIASGRPELLEQIPRALTDEDGTQRDNPDFTAEHRKLIDQYRLAADARRLDNLKVERGFSKMDIVARWQDMLENDNPIPDEEIWAQWGKDSLFGDDELMQWRGRSAALRKALRDVAVFDEFDAIDPNQPAYTQINKLDQHGEVITEERVRRYVDRTVERRYAQLRQALPEDVPDELVWATSVNQTIATESMTYRPLQNTLEHVPTDDPKRFFNAAKAYEALPLEQRARYVTSDVRRAQFEQVLAREAAGEKPAEIMADLRAIDPKRESENLARNREQMLKEFGKIDGMLVRDTNLLSMWGQGLDVKVSQLADPDYVRSRVEELMRVHIGRAGVTPEVARERAFRDVMSTHFVIKSNGAFRLMPRIDGVTERFGEALQWAESEGLAELAAEHKIALPEGVRLVFDPANRENNQLIAVDETGFPFRGDVLRFDPKLLEQQWRAGLTEHADRQKASRGAQRRRELEQRFYEENPEVLQFQPNR